MSTPTITRLPVRSFSPARLREARLSAGLTLDDVARLIGRDERTVIRYEGGHHEPRTAVLAILADGLGVTIDSLFTDPIRS